MDIGIHRKARRRKDALRGLDISAVEPKTFSELQPAFDTALGIEISIVILNAMPPFETDIAVAKTRDHHRILDRNGALVVVAVQRPGLHLSLIELAAVQQPMKRMQVMIAGRAD